MSGSLNYGPPDAAARTVVEAPGDTAIIILDQRATVSLRVAGPMTIFVPVDSLPRLIADAQRAERNALARRGAA